ncbi:bifunctional tRNA (5-methylaminomethyl-2-thiouridine)(34)-methyltransferase MnmD/FAD-dependent 5-carboxymethylaminomethyl-2-thiouridine(34) oxidoreductase MnmC [Erwinia sp. OLTSP20]|uniref:bifunctional tRNA (5-methylaminomethyl-2-thiouridine)(34)-methyltransferase MnmD/FAD-dependent 5-carboxymethylaminomethyl-2-thiouridine(34) oxidoreductase MnmC n=1 Tax=unclassified Erwinia TaxID=2622719 RepID=UPI000C192D79|nr:MULTISPECIES: bifunctional tRNA (5-methylaminomethyl-2-thiouridine)(34)-methyltransferase MnmD/FAD-dependent 5-carboxymethylaminomethyl-2-thiouridine(34) oxidoreductase MnmC [unclassified Erwinia]PIJ51519.1 bifunctional tRNA (5-methylaminomethyl-2-thiouridine)(34)-methyltransferase MnmD/FAD-dependent 5-carboxymethylaminomethyl-2-thiouridine(34) oxidoreductase MnmC [Erwinia sp. OAMSP11]PIJ75894.1 bifunctional tRNA (5-methylaminomethyl-2-thiouridine)(34)-methyltransferase MnmD/FAD-dependent 5-ca
MKNLAVEHASLSWNEQGTPVSRTFDDVYFSNQSGLQETRYVFLAGNQLPQRFACHPRALFVVAETGFGTGLNFLTLCQAFTAFLADHPQARLQRLHFISCEKYPLTAKDMIQAHQHWPELADWSQALLSQWPQAMPGCHRLLFAAGRITLDLWYGDINQLIDTFDDSLQQQVDAWFLDGFAPAKNPDMWTPPLFHCMARLARPGATLATFTAAGFVRRGLQQAGFTMVKRKGFGPKREMLCGTLNQACTPLRSALCYHRPPARNGDIAVIGGGIASALLALALLRRGCNVTLYSDARLPAQGASGNRQGALYPLLNPHDSASGRFFPAAFTFARRYFDALDFPFAHQWCGVTQLGWDEKSQRKIDNMLGMALPAAIACAVNAEQAEQLAGLPTGCGGIHYPQGGWLCPADLTTGLITQAQQQGLTLYWQHKLEKLTEEENGWRLHFADGSQRHHPNLVLANGAGINQLAQSARLPVYPVAGQVSHVPTNASLAQLKQVLCYDGYLTPVSPQHQQHCIGASYHRGSQQTTYSPCDQQENIARLQNCLVNQSWPLTLDASAGEARCGVRCATRDHLPMLGALPDYQRTLQQYSGLTPAEIQQQTTPAPWHQGIFVLGAFGSRGLCSAPLAAEILAAQICGEPIPLDAATLAALNPNRYWIRKLLKGKPLIK